MFDHFPPGRKGWVIVGQGQKAEHFYAPNEHIVFFVWGAWRENGELMLNPERGTDWL